ncbi:MAG: recombinase family protein [Deltaproteobacteria bacterium]|nr:recombinase family protein [Deltaproteobacteria bacterium]
MKTIGYVRVSTEKQSREGLSLGAQEKAIRHYCELYEMGLTDVVVDRGVSAKSIKGRPGMERLISLVESDAVKAVVVYKIDRMFRSIRDALHSFDLFKEHKVQFHSVIEKWDTSTAMGEFAMNMLLSMAQLERRQTSERTSFTLREKKVANSHTNALMSHRTQTGKLTVGQAPYGWQFKEKVLIEHPEEMPVVRKITNMKKEGASIAAIMKWLKDNKVPPRYGKSWHKKQIYRIVEAIYNRQ